MKLGRHGVLALLTAIMVFNYVDRVALGLMMQDIKTDLSLSDTQLGLLTGIAFAAFYATAGIPIARLADRGNRVTIVSVAVAFWTGAVALGSLATNFFQLLLLRIGVAIGEAGCHPPAFSLLSDYFNKAERPRAIAIYMLGWPLALIVGNLATGWLSDAYGWRATFIFLALPGVVLAVLAKAMIAEPRRNAGELGPSGSKMEARPNAGNFGEVMRTLWSNRPYRYLLFCFSLSYFFGNGITQWQPSFFMRSYGVSAGELGVWFAAIYGVGGLLGTYAGGELAERFAKDNERRQLLGIAFLYVVLTFANAGIYLAPSLPSTLVALTIAGIGGAIGLGPAFALTQTFVPDRMRATSVAIVLFFSNLIGLGLGPLAAGALSDLFGPALGDDSLRFALLVLCPGYLACAWCCWRAMRTLPDSQLAIPQPE